MVAAHGQSRTGPPREIPQDARAEPQVERSLRRLDGEYREFELTRDPPPEVHDDDPLAAEYGCHIVSELSDEDLHRSDRYRHTTEHPRSAQAETQVTSPQPDLLDVDRDATPKALPSHRSGQTHRVALPGEPEIVHPVRPFHPSLQVALQQSKVEDQVEAVPAHQRGREEIV